MDSTKNKLGSSAWWSEKKSPRFLWFLLPFFILLPIVGFIFTLISAAANNAYPIFQGGLIAFVIIPILFIIQSIYSLYRGYVSRLQIWTFFILLIIGFITILVTWVYLPTKGKLENGFQNIEIKAKETSDLNVQQFQAYKKLKSELPDMKAKYTQKEAPISEFTTYKNFIGKYDIDLPYFLERLREYNVEASFANTKSPGNFKVFLSIRESSLGDNVNAQMVAKHLENNQNITDTSDTGTPEYYAVLQSKYFIISTKKIGNSIDTFWCENYETPKFSCFRELFIPTTNNKYLKVSINSEKLETFFEYEEEFNRIFESVKIFQ